MLYRQPEGSFTKNCLDASQSKNIFSAELNCNTKSVSFRKKVMGVEITGEERHRNITSNAYRRSEQRYPVQQRRPREDCQNSTKLAAMPLQNTVPESDSLQRFPMTEVRFVIQ